MPDVCLNHVYGLCALLGALEVTDCSILPGKLNLMGIWLRFISLFQWKLWNGTSGPAELKSCVWVLPARRENIYFPLKMFDLKIQFRGGQPDSCTRKLGLPIVFTCPRLCLGPMTALSFLQWNWLVSNLPQLHSMHLQSLQVRCAGGCCWRRSQDPSIVSLVQNLLRSSLPIAF